MLIAFWIGFASAAEIRIHDIETLPGQKVRLTFEDGGIGALNYVPAQRPAVEGTTPGVLNIGTRTIEIAPGLFEAVVPGLDPSASFFQITGFLPPDVDGDGLSDALEQLAGTSTGSLDSDGDGYGDANELANGSDPLSAGSVPAFVRVEFELPESAVREGDGVLMVPVTASRPFTGVVRYRVAAMSTAEAGVDFMPLTGSLNMDGTSAMLAIVMVDDLVIDDVKLLVIDLENAAEAGYQVGGASRHSILLRDNDGYWAGVLRREDSEQTFRLRMLRQGEAVTVALVSDFDPNDREGMRGVGAIPPGVWDMASATLTTDTFRAMSGVIPMGTSTLFGESALDRVLIFDSSPAPEPEASTNYLFKPNLIIGTYTDRLVPASEELQYLARETAGLFVLMQELSVLPVPDLPAVPLLVAGSHSGEVLP